MFTFTNSKFEMKTLWQQQEQHNLIRKENKLVCVY